MARPHATGLAALVLAGLLLASRLPGATAALSDEDALLALKASFSNGEAVLPSWQRGTDVCAWKGVSCDAARSVAILCVRRVPCCLPLCWLRCCCACSGSSSIASCRLANRADRAQRCMLRQRTCHMFGRGPRPQHHPTSTQPPALNINP